MDWLPDVLIVAVLVVAFVLAFLVKEDDPAWLERWNALPPAERARLVAAARSGSLLPSQEDIELAAGFARRDRRRRSPYTLIYALRIPIGIALIAGGMVADSIVFVGFGVLFLAGGLWAVISQRRTYRAERETIDRDHSLERGSPSVEG